MYGQGSSRNDYIEVIIKWGNVDEYYKFGINDSDYNKYIYIDDETLAKLKN